MRVDRDVCGFAASLENLTMVSPFGDADGPRWHVRGTGADETVLLRKGASIWASMAGGDDRVSGSSGDDNLRGGPGDDRLYGGGGNNIANGGAGTDTCRKVEPSSVRLRAASADSPIELFGVLGTLNLLPTRRRLSESRP